MKYSTNGLTLTIVPDNDSDSPRTWDNLTQFIFVGNKKHLGDKHDFKCGTYENRLQFMEQGAKDVAKYFGDVAVCFPIHCYQHSGISISVKYEHPYNDYWDSGTLGFAIITKAQIRENFSIKKVTKKYLNKAIEILEGEVETLNQWLNGDVYGFQLTNEKGEEVDSCYGFYGSDVKTNGILDHLPKEFEELFK